MAYIVKCDKSATGGDVRFVGPFASEMEANVYIDLPVWNSSRCLGSHSVEEIYKPEVENFEFSQVVRLITERQSRSRDEVVLDMARNSKPFGVGIDGRIYGQPDVLMLGIPNIIATIKELRSRYPGLGLKDAKDIVEDWRSLPDE